MSNVPRYMYNAKYYKFVYLSVYCMAKAKRTRNVYGNFTCEITGERNYVVLILITQK